MLRFVPRDSQSACFPRPQDMPEALHLLLMQRGISSAADAEAFLHPAADQLISPMLLSDMGAAAARVRLAVERGENICVFGDYDVDGVCACAILYLHLKSLGAEPEVYLPSRHREGYGLNDAAMRALAERNTLMVTVDCGISCAPQVELAKSLGMDCVVTDHHRPGDLLPDCPTVNPLLNDYPFPSLCGAGVAFKLVAALSGQDAALPYADLAALATVADLVPLTGENRVLVHLGLEKINRAPRVGVRALAVSAGLEGRALTAGNIAFQLAPRLNAGGRLGDARRSFDLLTEMDEAEAALRAGELEAENSRRKAIEQEIAAQAEKQLEGFDFPGHRVLVLAGEGWNPGVIGLAASRLTEKYCYPSILLAVDGEDAVGSCRSIPDVDIFQALCGVSDLFSRFGGHRQAAGLAMKARDIPELQRRLDEALFASIPPEAYIPRAEYDLELPFPRVSEALVNLLDRMQPTGFGNPAPLFLTRARVEEARGVGADGSHLKLRLQQDRWRMDGICFREGGRAAEVLGQDCDVLYTPRLNAFNGRVSVQAEAKALEVASGPALIRSILPREEEQKTHFLTELLYNKREFLSPESGISLEELRDALAGSPQGTLVLAADARDAAGLAEALDGLDFDLCVGSAPADPRCFNALCLYPAGKLPAGYRRIVLAGMPAFPAESADALMRLDGFPAPDWLRELPDTDGLREMLKALIALTRRPCLARDRRELAGLMVAAAGCGLPAAAGGLIALEELGLVAVEEGAAPCFRMEALRKTDPTQSAAFRRMQALRTAVTEGGDCG